MALAIAAAREAWGLTSPNPMVGAVAVKQDRVLGSACHLKAGSAHAEAALIAQAGAEAMRDATVYVTLEPCCTTGRTPPCTAALIGAGVKKVVVGTVDPNPSHGGRGIDILRDAGIEVIAGVLAEECRELNRAFFKWITTGKPFVLLKMAMTLDGKIATPDGVSKWITGEAARSRVQELRRWADAIMVTAKTARLDNPRLNVREPANWRKRLKKIIAADTTPLEDIRAWFPDDPDIRKFCCSGRGDWEELLNELGSEEITALLIEGGGELAGNALASGVVDAIEFHIAPKLLLGRASRPITGGEALPLPEAIRLENMKTEFIGADIVVRADIAKG